MAWAPFTYRDFYDVPRMVLFDDGDAVYLLDCPFDDVRDEYPDRFTVYRMRETAQRLDKLADWSLLPGMGEKLGTIAVRDVRFDEARRERIDTGLLTNLAR